MAYTSGKKVIKKSKIKNRLFSNLLIFIGSSIIATVIIVTNYSRVLAFFYSSPPIVLKTSVIKIFPTQLEFEDVGRKTPVIIGNFKENEWQTANDFALYLNSSGIPGQNGNIVIYGHNTNRVFGYLSTVKIGNKIKLTTNNHNVINYRITSINNVMPSDVDVLKQTDKEEQITIFTCSGLFDSLRLIVTGTRV